MCTCSWATKLTRHVTPTRRSTMSFTTKFKEKTRIGSSKKRQKEESEAWVLEGIVEFLRSPTWTVPVINFIEQHCEHFENTEENKFSYTSIHKEYNQLVEELLNKYTEELGISSDQFARACEKNEATMKYLNGMFEYIWAADDFLLFKDIMLKRNQQLDKETMNLDLVHAELEIDDEIAEKEYEKLMAYALRRSEADFEKKSFPPAYPEEDDDLQEAIRFSKMEMERMNRIAQEENMMMERAISLSLAESSNTTASHSPVAATATYHRTHKSPEPALPSTEVPTEYPVQLGNGAVVATATAPAQEASSQREPHDTTPELKKKLHVTTPELNMKHHVTTPEPVLKMETKPKVIADLNMEPRQETQHVKNITNEDTKVKADKRVKSPVKDLPPIKQTPRETSPSEAANAWLNSAVNEITQESNRTKLDYKSSPTNKINPDEVAKRKAHLKEQREKILEFKRLEREKELHEYNEAKDSCYDDDKKVGGEDPEAKAASSKEKKLNARRALAAKLKREVVNKR